MVGMTTSSLKVYDLLKSAHLPEPQARAIVQAIGTSLQDSNLSGEKKLAAKVDAAKFALDMSHLEAAFKQDMAVLRQDMSEFRQDVLKMESSVRTDIANVKSEMLRWMFVFWVGQVAAVISVIKLIK